jgi:signal peptidase II
MFKTARTLLLVGIILSTVGCDRITKHFAAIHLASQSADHEYLAGTLRFEYAENNGGFLSLGATLPARMRLSIFTFGATLLLGLVAVVLWKYSWDSLTAAGLSLTLAGGASNLFDRVVHGSVVDFVNVGIGPIRTGIFNIADVAICTGLIIVALTATRLSKDRL